MHSKYMYAGVSIAYKNIAHTIHKLQISNFNIYTKTKTEYISIHEVFMEQLLHRGIVCVI